MSCTSKTDTSTCVYAPASGSTYFMVTAIGWKYSLKASSGGDNDSTDNWANAQGFDIDEGDGVIVRFWENLKDAQFVRPVTENVAWVTGASVSSSGVATFPSTSSTPPSNNIGICTYCDKNYNSTDTRIELYNYDSSSNTSNKLQRFQIFVRVMGSGTDPKLVFPVDPTMIDKGDP